MTPTGWESFSLDTRVVRQGPRPLKTMSYRVPRRVSRIARRGEVIVEFLVDEDGRPRKPEVIESNPPGAFDRYALATIKDWRYQPDRVDGQAVVSGPVRQVLRFDAGAPPEQRPPGWQIVIR